MRFLLSPALYLAVSVASPASAGANQERDESWWLFAMARQARSNSSCIERVPIEHARSYPVPGPRNSKGIFRVLFYPLDRRTEGMPGLLPPEVVAQFSVADASVKCDDFVAPGLSSPSQVLGPRFSEEVRGFSGEEFERREESLYRRLLSCAEAYSASRHDRKTKRDAQAFLDAFQVLSEPGLRPYYYQLNADFWDWLRDLTGRTVVDDSEHAPVRPETVSANLRSRGAGSGSGTEAPGSRKAPAGLAGTKWVLVDPSIMERSVLHFLAGGRLEKTTLEMAGEKFNEPILHDGTWTQTGHAVYFEINNRYAEFRGTIEGDRIEGSMSNAIGLKSTWSATRE